MFLKEIILKKYAEVKGERKIYNEDLRAMIYAAHVLIEWVEFGRFMKKIVYMAFKELEKLR